MLRDATTAVLERFLDLASVRHQVLSANVANADTPGYKAVDFDFQGEMKKAWEAQTAPGEARAGDDRSPELYQVPATNPSADGNTVSMEVEMAKMSENAMLYGAVSQILAKHLAMVRDAISSAR